MSWRPLGATSAVSPAWRSRTGSACWAPPPPPQKPPTSSASRCRPGHCRRPWRPSGGDLRRHRPADRRRRSGGAAGDAAVGFRRRAQRSARGGGHGAGPSGRPARSRYAGGRGVADRGFARQLADALAAGRPGGVVHHGRDRRGACGLRQQGRRAGRRGSVHGRPRHRGCCRGPGPRRDRRAGPATGREARDVRAASRPPCPRRLRARRPTRASRCHCSPALPARRACPRPRWTVSPRWSRVGSSPSSGRRSAGEAPACRSPARGRRRVSGGRLSMPWPTRSRSPRPSSTLASPSSTAAICGRLLLQLLPRRQPSRRRGPHRADVPPGLSPLRARAARVEGRPLRPWLIRIAHNLAANFYRDRSRKPESAIEDAGMISAPHTTESLVEGREELKSILAGVHSFRTTAARR